MLNLWQEKLRSFCKHAYTYNYSLFLKDFARHLVIIKGHYPTRRTSSMIYWLMFLPLAQDGMGGLIGVHRAFWWKTKRVTTCSTLWETGQELKLQNKQQASNPFPFKMGPFKRSVSQSPGKAIILRIKPAHDVRTRKYLMLIPVHFVFLCISFKT